MHRILCRTLAVVLALSAIPAGAEVTALQIAKDETITVKGQSVRHLTGAVLGKAAHDEPGVPTLEHVAGVKYEAPFELWLPGGEGNGRFWFSVLNRGSDIGGLRDSILSRGGGYGWCTWQAKNVAAPRPQLKLTGFTGPLPQAYGLLVVRDFVTFLRYALADGAVRNPAAGKIQHAFAFGISQSGRLMRTFLLYRLNSIPAGRVFDGFIPHGARAGYLDIFRPDSDPGAGGTFTAETVHSPYSWAEVLGPSDAKVFALNAENEYYDQMAYMSRHGTVPENVRIYEFPLGGHGGGGTVPWNQCVAPLAAAMEDWAAKGTKPPESRLFVLEKRESPRAKHLPADPAELPVTDDLGIARGGVRLPPVEVPTNRYVEDGKNLKAVPLDNAELTRRYGTPEKYRQKVAEAADRLIRERLLPETYRAKYTAEAEKMKW